MKICVLGPASVGKTTLALALTSRLKEKGRNVKYVEEQARCLIENLREMPYLFWHQYVIYLTQKNAEEIAEENYVDIVIESGAVANIAYSLNVFEKYEPWQEYVYGWMHADVIKRADCIDLFVFVDDKICLEGDSIRITGSTGEAMRDIIRERILQFLTFYGFLNRTIFVSGTTEARGNKILERMKNDGHL